MIKVFNRVAVELVTGNIVEQFGYTAIVNAANSELMPGGGVAGAIHWAAGSMLAEECKPLAPINPGDAVITGGHKLPNKFVIHTLGPVYGINKPEEKLLANCYKNSLRIAEENEIDSIAFPAISAGAFGYPFREAAEVALKTIIDMTKELNTVKFIRMVLFTNDDMEIFTEVLENLNQK